MAVYKILAEATFASAIAFRPVGFKPPYPKKSKRGFDYFVPPRHFSMLTRLAVPKGYTFPDFSVKRITYGKDDRRKLFPKGYVG